MDYFGSIKKPFIYVFDSGVGGISVLRALVSAMPGEDFLYFGDSKNAPYGTRETEDVRNLTSEHVSAALDAGAKAVCIACNTATSAAVRYLREIYPDVPLVGIEPSIKPAALEHPGGRVLVLGTPITIREKKFRHLMDRWQKEARIIPVPCPGLMEFVESGEDDTKKIRDFLNDLLSPFLDEPADAAVLGCTHYPFVRGLIQEVLGSGAQIYDGAEGTARELRRRLRESGLSAAAPGPEGTIVIENSLPGEAKELKREQCFRLLRS